MTQGCRWQEKSFSVAVKEKETCLCRDCGLPIEAVFKHNGDSLCRECFSKRPNHLSQFGSFFTHKDLKYNFVTDMFDGKPIEIHSKRQYKSLLKKHNLADASLKECRQEAEFRKRINEESYAMRRKKTAEKIFSENREVLRFRRVK